MPTSNTIKISAPLQFYIENDVNSSAIEQVLAADKRSKVKSADSISIGMSWDELESYVHAQVAVKRVQGDFWHLLKLVHEQTWGAMPLGDSLKEVELRIYGTERGINSVWDYKYLTKYYEDNNGDSLVLSCGLDDSKDKSLYLSFYLDKSDEDDYKQTNELDLPIDYWIKEPDENERITQSKLCQFGKRSTLDLTELKKSAAIAISSLFD